MTPSINQSVNQWHFLSTVSSLRKDLGLDDSFVVYLKALSAAQHRQSKCKDDEWTTNCKVRGRKRLWDNFRNYHGRIFEMLKEVTKKLISTSDLQEDVWSQDLSNTKPVFVITALSTRLRFFNSHNKKRAYLQSEGSHKPNNRNKTYRSSSSLSHRHSKRNKWLSYSTCKPLLTQSGHRYRGKAPFPIDTS
jgi:hypothetical protein